MFWIGLFLYSVSFLLISVGDRIPNSRPDRGYDSAVWSLFFAYADIKLRLLGNHGYTQNLLECFSLFVSSLINVFFLSFLSASRIWRQSRRLQLFGFLILLMIPFCWIVFYYQNMYPREGHFAWVLGMLLVVLGNNGDRIAPPRET